MWFCYKCNVVFDAVKSKTGVVQCVKCHSAKFVVNNSHSFLGGAKKVVL